MKKIFEYDPLIHSPLENYEVYHPLKHSPIDKDFFPEEENDEDE